MRLSQIIIIVITGIIFNSCQKTFNAPVDATIKKVAELKATINGVQFVSELAGAVRRSDAIISIAGKSNDGKFIAFTLVDSGVHLYKLDMKSNVNFCGYEDNGLAFSSHEGINPGDSGGTLAITQIDPISKTMSGTFNIVVFRQLGRIQRMISDGIFNNIPY